VEGGKFKEKKGERGPWRAQCAWPTWPRPCNRTGGVVLPRVATMHARAADGKNRASVQGLTCASGRPTARAGRSSGGSGGRRARVQGAFSSSPVAPLIARFRISFCKIYRAWAKWVKFGFSEKFRKISDENVKPKFEFWDEK
jgi:hypothetical protein